MIRTISSGIDGSRAWIEGGSSVMILKISAVMDSPAEGLLPREHLVEHASDGEEIAAPVDIAAPGLLRAHVGRRAQETAGHREVLARVECLRDAEVRHLHSVARLDHDVGGLDVPVNDVPLVGEVQPVGDLGGDRRGALHGQMARAGYDLLEPDAVDELHRQVRDAVGLADVVDGDDVGVLELRGNLGLALEAVDQLLEARSSRGQPLQANGLDGHHAARGPCPSPCRRCRTRPAPSFLTIW